MALPTKKVRPNIIALPATPAKSKKLRAIIIARMKMTTPKIHFLVSSGKVKIFGLRSETSLIFF